MTKLLNFLNALPPDKRTKFAKRCGTSFAYLRQVAYGNRPCSELLAMLLERESRKQLCCEELCPDAPWYVVRNK